ncbi:MAG: enoyl-CoA hydratase/isomerase family protein [Bacteroidota bacterium]
MSLVKSTTKNQYEILELNRGKANPINDDLVTEIRSHFQRIAQSSDSRGIILTGNTPGYFSVGLDLKELFYYDEDQIQQFWQNWEGMVHDMLHFPKPFICAINGHSPAGGCVMAVMADMRLMAAGEEFKIGLNEIGVGIVVPEYIFQTYAFWIGKRQAYQNLMLARLLSVAEAHEQKLIDQVCAMDELLPAAEKMMQHLLMAPDNLIQLSKKNMRQELFDRLASIPVPSPQARLDAWFNPQSRAVMKMLVDQLEGK